MIDPKVKCEGLFVGDKKVIELDDIRARFNRRVAEAELIRLRNAVPKPKPEEEPEELEPEQPEQEKVEPEEEEPWTAVERGEVVVSRKAQLDNAKLFVKHKLTLTSGKSSTLDTYFYQGDWWQWNKSFYERAPEQRIIDMACDFLDNARARSDEGGTVKFKPTTRDLSSLVTFSRSCTGLDDRTTPPRWLDDRPSPRPENLLAFQNCLVDVTAGETHPHDPRLWMHDGVDFNYDPDARCPHWEDFLAELFPDDVDARQMIEEELGYGMTIDNQFEKAALWVGPPRSGRGTIAHIQELLVGVNGHTSLDIHTWHKSEYSRMGMIGKRVGIFHDIRLRPPRWYGQNLDPGGVDSHSQQLLLEFISGDFTEIGRKYLEAWKGKPFTKFRLISNKVPNFNDEVLITRFNTIEFTKSFLGKEKPELKLKVLPAELPGIANRCLAGYRQLLARGQFIQPKCGKALLNRVRAAVDPWTAFMDAYWDIDPGEGTRCSVFDATFKHWCLETRRMDIAATSPSDIIQKINRIPEWEFLKSFRPASKPDEKQRPRYYRVKFKSGVKLPEQALADLPKEALAELPIEIFAK
jgi:putative DNA primase/helicase